MAKIGDISRPPMGGIMRLNGRKTGSAIIEATAATGLYVFGITQLRMMRIRMAKKTGSNSGCTTPTARPMQPSTVLQPSAQ